MSRPGRGSETEREAIRRRRANERDVRRSDQKLSGKSNLWYLQQDVAEDRRQLGEIEKERKRWEEYLLDDLRKLWRYLSFLRRRW